jgi:hypothetical protein
LILDLVDSRQDEKIQGAIGGYSGLLCTDAEVVKMRAEQNCFVLRLSGTEAGFLGGFLLLGGERLDACKE